MGKRSRKRGATIAPPQPSATEPVRARAAAPVSHRARIDDAPKAPWSPFPLTELVILLALATLVVALAMVGSKDRGLLPNGLPFLTLVAAWIVGYFVLRAREQSELKREIEQLDDLERDTR